MCFIYIYIYTNTNIYTNKEKNEIHFQGVQILNRDRMVRRIRRLIMTIVQELRKRSLSCRVSFGTETSNMKINHEC